MSKNKAAVALGRLGGLKGGKARMKALSAEERSALGRKAARKRWEERKGWITALVERVPADSPNTPAKNHARRHRHTVVVRTAEGDLRAVIINAKDEDEAIIHTVDNIRKMTGAIDEFEILSVGFV